MRRAIIAALLVLVGCAGSREVGRAFEPRRLSSESGWTAAANVPVLRQSRELDCGPVATAMLLEFWGRRVEPDELRVEARVKPDRGLAAGAIRHLLRARGLLAFLVVGDVGDLQRELAAGRPVLVGLAKPFAKDKALGHYEIVIAVNPSLNEVVTVDPGSGYRTYALEVFKAQWEPTKRLTLIVGPGAEEEDGVVARNAGARR
jgi:ABC-type bacteriocin/lantibiotic exporter with double-glycine peptidase domain